MLCFELFPSGFAEELELRVNARFGARRCDLIIRYV